jgi:hypothetical protein
MPIYIHRGRVDTQFLGVVIRAESVAELEAFRSMDRAASLPVDQLSQLGIEAFMSEMARLTVLDHEIRHFHDTLLHPFGAAVLGRQLTLAINALTLVSKSVHTSETVNVLPIPLQEWLTRPASERANFLERNGGPGRQPTPPDLPVLDPDDSLADLPRGITPLDGAELITATSRVVLSSYRALEAMWRAPHPPGEDTIASAAVLWEAPATLCQLAAIQRIADEASMQRFADWLLKHGPQRYRRGLQLLDTISPGPPGTYQARQLLALATWSQMGPFNAETSLSESSPAGRLNRLWNASRRGLRWSGNEPFVDLVALWDESIGRSSLADLDDSTRETASVADRYIRRADQEGNPTGAPLTTAARAFQAYYRAHLAMREAFLREPDTYVDPMSYVEGRSIYPKPTVVVSYEDELSGGQLTHDWIDATPPDWRPAIDSNIAHDLGALVLLTSVILLPSDETPEPGAQSLIQKHFGVEPLREPS